MAWQPWLHLLMVSRLLSHAGASHYEPAVCTSDSYLFIVAQLGVPPTLEQFHVCSSLLSYPLITLSHPPLVLPVLSCFPVFGLVQFCPSSGWPYPVMFLCGCHHR